jgi:hypothetical protein
MTPPSDNLVEPDVFNLLLDLEAQKALRLCYPLAVLCVTPDIPQGSADAASITEAARTVLSRLRATDVVTVLPRSAIAILLIDAELTALREILERIVRPMPFGARVSLTWSAGGSAYPRSVATAADLLRLSSDLMNRARQEGGDRLYLAPGP